VLSTLGQIAPRGHLPSQVVLRRVAARDRDPSVRLAALDALDAIAAGRGTFLRDAVLSCLTDEDEVVQDAAMELHGRLRSQWSVGDPEVVCLGLLYDLAEAFEDPLFQNGLRRLHEDRACGNEHRFRFEVAQHAFTVQRRVLPKHGFAGTRQGVELMMQVVRTLGRSDANVFTMMTRVNTLIGAAPLLPLKGSEAARAASTTRAWVALLQQHRFSEETEVELLGALPIEHGTGASTTSAASVDSGSSVLAIKGGTETLVPDGHVSVAGHSGGDAPSAPDGGTAVADGGSVVPAVEEELQTFGPRGLLPAAGHDGWDIPDGAALDDGVVGAPAKADAGGLAANEGQG